jgi:NADPH:quinone reductase-like Zn-dependent oxidoreductase
VRELTGGKGADVVYDPVGGDAFDQALRAVNWEARMLVIGFASGRIQAVPANLILVKNISVIGVVWGAQTERDPVWMSRTRGQDRPGRDRDGAQCHLRRRLRRLLLRVPTRTRTA